METKKYVLLKKSGFVVKSNENNIIFFESKETVRIFAKYLELKDFHVCEIVNFDTEKEKPITDISVKEILQMESRKIIDAIKQAKND